MASEWAEGPYLAVREVADTVTTVVVVVVAVVVVDVGVVVVGVAELL